MSGTLSGGKAAAKTNKKRHGNDFYARIGKIGGKNGTTGGFYADRESASKAGYLGGKRSRRGLKFVKETPVLLIYTRISNGEKLRIRK